MVSLFPLSLCRTIEYIAATMKVSVIIPVFNKEQCVMSTIDSVLQQRHRDLEVLLIDDGSSDQSGDFCDQAARNDARVNVYHNTHRGVSETRNFGLRKARGTYVMFVDADDFLPPDSIQKFVEQLGRQATDIIVGNYTIIANHDASRQYTSNFYTGNAPRLPDGSYAFSTPELLHLTRQYLARPSGNLSILVTVWGKMFSKEFLSVHDIKFQAGLDSHEDSEFNFECLRHHPTVSFLPFDSYHYCIGNNPLNVASLIRSPFAHYIAFKKIAKYLQEHEQETEPIMSNAIVYFAISTLVRYAAYVRQGKKIRSHIRQMVVDPQLRRSLRWYVPKGKDSKIIPHLIRARMVWAIYIVCWFKMRRYLRTYPSYQSGKR